MKREEAAKALYELAKEIDFLENTIMTLSWDMRVNLPKQAGEYRGNTIGFLSGQVFEQKTSKKLDEIIQISERGPGRTERRLCRPQSAVRGGVAGSPGQQ